MAGDWIKMRCDLQTHPKVVRIASALKADKLRVIGALHAVWSLFDTHSTDGCLEGYSLAEIDAMLAWKGFGRALVSVEWMACRDDGGGLALPRFDSHNGTTAKRRSMDSDRKRAAREAGKLPEKEAEKVSAKRPHQKRTKSGPEKRREDTSPPKSPSGGLSGERSPEENPPRRPPPMNAPQHVFVAWGTSIGCEPRPGESDADYRMRCMRESVSVNREAA